MFGSVLFALVAVVVVSVGLWTHRTTHASPGQTITFAGQSLLSASISYDANGIPTVTAPNYPSAMAGLCYAQASQRLFQMYQSLWTANGVVSSYLGAGLNQANVTSDELFATLDVQDQANAAYAHATGQTQQLLSACAQGINTFAKTQPLPHEFTKLQITPATWTPQDSEEILLFFDISLDLPNWLTKIISSSLAFGPPSLASDLVPVMPNSPSMFDASGHLNSPSTFLNANAYNGNPLDSDAVVATVRSTTSTTSASLQQTALHPMAGLVPQLSQRQMSVLTAGIERMSAAVPEASTALSGPESNNFAVSGAHTQDGLALVANDQHVILTVPSTEYLAKVQLPSMALTGSTVPGAPVFGNYLATHTGGPTIAVSDTFVIADVDDVYAETTQTVPTSVCASTQQATVDGQLQCETVRPVTITVAGGSPVTFSVYSTSHGPIINPAFNGSLDAIGQLSLRMDTASSNWTIDGFISMPLATTRQGIVAAAAQESIGLNIIYGINQHIGYQMAALIPLRNRLNGQGIVSGNDATTEWTGFATQSQLPSVFDPPSGFLNTSNNRIVPDNYPIYITNFEDAAFRAQTAAAQLNTWVNSGHKVTVADFEQLQLNTQSGSAAITVPALLSVANRVGVPTAVEAADLKALASWDDNTAVNSHAALVYEVWDALLTRDLAETNTGGGAFYQFYAQTVLISNQLQASYLQMTSPDAALMTPAQRDTWVMTALNETEQLISTVGLSTWGDLHRLFYNQSHPFAVPNTSYFDSDYAIGLATGFARPGDASTLNVGGWFLTIGLLALPADQLTAAGGVQAAFAQDAGPATRVIFDEATPSQSVGINSVGESGEPGPHYADMLPDWLNGTYVPIGN